MDPKSLSTRRFEEFSLQVYENREMIFGFTQLPFSATALQRYFSPRPLVFLKQVHSDRVIRIGKRPTDAPNEADGILLTAPGPVAVIQTADCLPLFFFADDFSVGGIVHAGWRGLQQGIERKLLAMLPGSLDRYSFYLGPAIEKKCYPVGEDLRRLFTGKPYADAIFARLDDGKYLLDLKMGVTMSLIQAGIAAEKITGCGICTYCAGHSLPSYRRDGKTGRRIFNFLALK